MGLDDERIDRLAGELARITGESLADAVVTALEERIGRARSRSPAEAKRIADELMEIGRRFAALPVLDPRSPDEILGYDENGLPT